MMNEHTQKNQGYAFVEYMDPTHAKEAVKHLNGYPLQVHLYFLTISYPLQVHLYFLTISSIALRKVIITMIEGVL